MKATPKTAPTTEWLPVSALVVDETVNTRPLKKAKVAEIANNFDPEAFRFIEVSARPRGKYAVLDGQHRIEAVRSLGWSNGQRVECKVHRGLTHERECQLFDVLNDQLKMAAIPRMLARIGAKSSPDLEISEIVEALGLRIGPTHADGQICSPKALYKVYAGARFAASIKGKALRGAEHGNPELLRDTLRLLLGSWGKNKDALRGDLIEGVGAFLVRYGDAVEIGALVTRLAQLRGGPLAVVADGRALASLHNSQLSSGIAGKLVFIYNQQRRSKKLPDWWAS